MSHDQLDCHWKIAELVAALGVIASLVYLAVQVRQNTRSIRASTYEGMLRGSGEFLLPLIQNRDLARSFERAIDRWSQLDYEEQVQTMYLLTQLFRNWEDAYYQHRQGTLKPWLWEAWQQLILSYFHQPGVQDWRRLRRVAYWRSCPRPPPSPSPAVSPTPRPIVSRTDSAVFT